MFQSSFNAVAGTLAFCGLGSSCLHFLEERRAVAGANESGSCIGGGGGGWVGWLLTRMAPAPDFRKELREELGAQVEQGMAKSGSLLAVLVELVGMAVDNRHSEIAALIAAARQPAEGRARAE